MWNTEDLTPERELLGHEGAVLACSVNEDGTRIVSCGECHMFLLHALHFAAIALCHGRCAGMRREGRRGMHCVLR